MAIRQPGVEVTQEIISASTTPQSADLATVVVGPCYQIMEAFDDSGNINSDALAGSYTDGKGTIGLELPGVKTAASVVESSIKVYSVLGATKTTLASSTDTITLVTASGSTTTSYANGAFVDTAAVFTSTAVAINDYLRITYQAKVYDLKITNINANGTTLTVTHHSDIQTSSIALTAYSIVRSPAQWKYQASSDNAEARLGTVADYVLFEATGSAVAGDAGDALILTVTEPSSPDLTPSASNDRGVGAENLFSSATANFTSTVGIVGDIGATKVILKSSATGANDAVVDILQTISGTALAVDPGLAAAATTGITYYILEEVAGTESTGTDGEFLTSGTQFKVASADWTSSGNTPNLADGSTYWLEVTAVGSGFSSGSLGVYLLDSSAISTHTIDLSGSYTAGDTGTAVTYKIWKQAATAADGACGANTEFSSSELIATIASVSPGDIVKVGGDSANVVSVGANSLTLDASTAAWNGGDTRSMTFFIYRNNATTAAFDGTVLTLLLKAALGVVSSTGTEIIAAIAADADSAAAFTVTKASSPVITVASSNGFDGGVDSASILLDENLIGDTAPTAYIYTSYKALRTDVAASGASSLLSFDSVSDITDSSTGIGPISVDNPLAVAAYLAILNGGGKTVYALGMDAVSDAQPTGTTTAWGSALTFLESQSVYSIAPLTQDPEILALVDTHVTSMSAAAQKGERICFLSRQLPSHGSATTIASGTAGNTASNMDTGDGLFVTNVDLSQYTELQGLAGGTATVAGQARTFVVVVTALSSATKSTDRAYGTSVVRYGVKVDQISAASNFKLKFSTATMSSLVTLGSDWNGLIDVTWTLYMIGLTASSSAEVASAVTSLGAHYKNKRTFFVWPPEVTSTLSGSSVNLTGEYLAVGWAAKVGANNPSQGFTNSTVAGYTGLKYSNGYFSQAQLDDIAGGGTFITTQATSTSPLSCRHQLATDVSTIQKRELSVTKSVDYVAKFLRNNLVGRIGTSRITQSFLDSLNIAIQGMLQHLTDTGIINSATLTSLEVDSSNPDTINLTILLAVIYPCNYIAITLQI